MDADTARWYYWKDGQVISEPRNMTSHSSTEHCGLICFDPFAAGDMGKWGRYESPPNYPLTRLWHGLGKDRMPKDFVLTLLLMGALDGS